MDIYCLVMAGGKGTRFWPESTSKKPKQYLTLVGNKSLLEETLCRFEELIPANKRFIVTVMEQKRLAETNSKNLINSNGLIFEPSGRNTAPCILLALATLVKQGAQKKDIICVVPSDHVILNRQAFRATISDATTFASEFKKIVTIGIKPNFPHTGYGYIHAGSNIKDSVCEVKGFKEKPDVETAKSYIASGEYFWNAGMFVGSIEVFLQEFELHAPNIFSSYSDLLSCVGDSEKTAKIYNRIPSDSIDYAVMEKSKNILVTPATFDWNDLGSWDALESVISEKDKNYIAAAKDTYFEESTGNIIFAPEKFVSLINVQDLVIVANEKTVVVMPKKDSQKVKNIVKHLENSGQADYLI